MRADIPRFGEEKTDFQEFDRRERERERVKNRMIVKLVNRSI
jgi:hypothetical protein